MSDEEFERLLLDKELSHEDILGFVGTTLTTLAATVEALEQERDEAIAALAAERAGRVEVEAGAFEKAADRARERGWLQAWLLGEAAALRAGDPKP